MKSDILVIGGGASGLMAAYHAARTLVDAGSDAQVTVLEKMPRPARKVMITGKGRCNFTNVKDWDAFSGHVRSKPNFVKSAFYNLPPQAVVDWFEAFGMPTVVERGDRAFPASHHASDVVDTLVSACLSLGVKIETDAEVADVFRGELPRSGGGFRVLLSDGRDDSFKGLIDKSLNLLYTIALPSVALLLVLSPEVVTLLAGADYVPSIRMSRIVIPMLFVVGIAQVIAFQILIPKGFDKVTLTASVIGAVIGVTCNVLLVGRFGAIGTCWTVVITEICVTTFYILSARSRQLLTIDWRSLLLQLACSLPYVLIALLAQRISSSIVVTLAVAALLSAPYFLFSQTRIIRNELVLGFMKNLTRKK